MPTIQGTIESLSRQFNQGWRIGTLRGLGKVTGLYPADCEVGDFIAADGEYVSHPRYGEQFEATQIRREIPSDTRGLRDYLDKWFPFIGPITAMALIERFGESLFDVMEKNHQLLVAVKGITEARAQQIHEQYLEIKSDVSRDQFFSRHMITPAMVNRLILEYGDKQSAIDTIEANPYLLADEVWGIGFKKADLIAQSMGIAKDSRRRINAGLEWVLQEASQGEGHCCLPRKELIKRACEILESDAEKVGALIESKIAGGDLVESKDDMIYLAMLWAAEIDVASKLCLLAGTPQEVMMSELEESDLASMDSDQRLAVDYALRSRILVITGGPGVGKTYTVNMILKALGRERDVSLAAPTGKAAKRMSEATGREAMTLHRLLRYVPGLGFTVNRENPLKCDTLIVDESSMIDITLMHHLCDALTVRTQIIFVGDVDQLPSVGPGRVLGDMIDSGVIPTVRLTQLHRQAEHSFINRNAQRINRGEMIELPDQNSVDSDFYFVQEEAATEIPDMIRKVIELYSSTKGMKPEDIQVLCPMKRGPAGTESLNTFLRPFLNLAGQPIKDSPFLTGDRVIQTKNNYDLEVFNGDVGVVDDMCVVDEFLEEKKLVVSFEDASGPRRVGYSRTQADQLQLAYSLTVHKSQGSEFPVVIVPVHTTNYIMLKRNLIYTAITRAKRCVILVGTLKAVKLAVKTVDASVRWTGLKQAMQ